MKPKYGDIRQSDGRVFTGYTRKLTKKYGIRKYEQWRSLKSLKKTPYTHAKLIKSVEARQNATRPENISIDYIVAVLMVILLILCTYVACQ
jgi:hypothetical protein